MENRVLAARLDQWRLSDFNAGSYPDPVEEFDHVTGAHTHTPVTGGRADLVLLGCPMDVDGPSVSAPVLRFQPFEPENAGDNGVASRGVDRNDFACGPAALEFHAERSALADLLGDLQVAQRGRATARPIPKAELGGRDRICGNRSSPFIDDHALVGRTNPYGVDAILGAGSQKQKEAQGEEPGDLHARR